jgi:anthranilate synthase/aminodeoxychorismate synthase-like glutamine amidotransferase
MVVLSTMVLMIDNYDSFTYNLVQYLGELGAEVAVYRNDMITIEQIEDLKPSHIIISPGPRTPQEAGVCVEVIRHFSGRIPILGVCLGHQCIGYAFGGKIIRAKRLMHGKTSPIRHDGKTIYHGLPNPFTATRYHSLVVDRISLPSCLEVSAISEDDEEIMGIRHVAFPPQRCVEGVQFHPESILTEVGKDLLRNFLEMTSK